MVRQDEPRQLIKHAIMHHRAGRMREAEAGYHECLRRFPDHPVASNLLGAVFLHTGRTEQAQKILSSTVQKFPDFNDARTNYAAVLKKMARHSEALEQVSTVLKAQPDHLEALFTAGDLHHRLGHLGDAAQCFKTILENHPRMPAAHRGLGRVLSDLGNSVDALACFQQSLELDPNQADTTYQLGNTLSDLQRIDEAIVAYNRVLTLQPENPSLHNALGLAFKDCGDFQQAATSFSKALEIDPDNTDALSNMCHLQSGDVSSGHRQHMERLYKSDAVPAQRRATLAFGLAMVMDRRGDTKQTFDILSEGHAIRRSLNPYNTQNTVNFFQSIKSTFNEECLARLTTLGQPGSTPIFVLGMPRSGTTLVEQILSSHSQVYGAGELKTLGVLAEAHLPMPYPAGCASISETSANNLTSDYLAQLMDLGGTAQRVVDKMPANSLLVGLAAALLPNARFIYCRREAMANCWSIFKCDFSDSHHYSHDLTDLGQYFRLHEALMEFWQQRLPGRLHTLDYENLVQDHETVINDLLQYCELDYESSCLNFQNTKRTIKTASALQVRRPLYDSSVEAWKSYQSHLAPLQSALL